MCIDYEIIMEFYFFVSKTIGKNYLQHKKVLLEQKHGKQDL